MTETENKQADQAPSGGNQEADRLTKLAKFRDELGVDPYGGRVDGLIGLTAALAQYDEAADEAAKADPDSDTRPTVRVAGRVVLHRDIGSLVFATLRDSTGDLQVAVSKKAVDKPMMKLAKLVDLGDIVVVSGKLARRRPARSRCGLRARKGLCWGASHWRRLRRSGRA